MTQKTIDPRSSLRQLDQSLIDTLLAEQTPPCISIHMPTARLGPDTRQNSIRFRSLLHQARDELAAGDKKLADRLTGPAMALAEDNAFWQHQLNALAIFLSQDQQLLVRLQRPIAREIVAVADSFHIKPLIRAMQGLDRFQLLAVTQKSVSLYEGDRDYLDLVPLHPGVPRDITEALGEEIRGGNLNVSHYGGLAHKGMFHGHHDNRDDRDQDLERYFRVLDKAIYDHHGRHTDLPLFLAADVDYHDRFRKVSHHPRLQKQGLRINPDASEVDLERLHAEMMQLLQPRMQEQTRELIEQFGTAKSRGLASGELATVAQAAAMGRISVLLSHTEVRIGGRVDGKSGALTLAPESDPKVDDVLDDLAEMTLRAGGRVLVLPPDVHPAPGGVAAVFRY